jgi:hypothetical protein
MHVEQNVSDDLLRYLIREKDIMEVKKDMQEASVHHSYDILGARMLWKPKEARILTNFIDQPM